MRYFYNKNKTLAGFSKRRVAAGKIAKPLV
jgi:hypothetical protein